MNLQKSSHPVHSHEHFQHLPPTVVVQEHHLQLHKQQQQRSHQFKQQTPKRHQGISQLQKLMLFLGWLWDTNLLLFLYLLLQ